MSHNTNLHFTLGTFQRLEVIGRPRNARTLALEERVLENIGQDPSLSTRIIANQEGSSQSTVWRILHGMLLYPYHFQRVQALEERDFPVRLQFCNWLEEQRASVENFEQKILFTDEAGFTRNGIFNFHNNHEWTDENPHAMVQKAHQQQFSLNVWAGIIGGHLIGPVFLPQRLNGQIYTNFLGNELPQLLENLPLLLRAQMYFMHDGAPPHFSIMARDHLNNTYRNRWIGRGGPVSWPPRSPDLNPLDFYLWGHVKQLVYSRPIPNIDVLKQRIEEAFQTIKDNPRILPRVHHNLIKRLAACRDANGNNFEHFL